MFVGPVRAGVGSWLVLPSWEGEEEDPQLLGKVCTAVSHQAGSQSIAGSDIPVNGFAVELSAVGPRPAPSPELLPA